MEESREKLALRVLLCRKCGAFYSDIQIPDPIIGPHLMCE